MKTVEEVKEYLKKRSVDYTALIEGYRKSYIATRDDAYDWQMEYYTERKRIIDGVLADVEKD